MTILNYEEFFSNERDRYFGINNYNKISFFEIIRPLIESINSSGGVSQIIMSDNEILPETTSTCLLALYKIGILSDSKKELMQDYVIKNNFKLLFNNEYYGWGDQNNLSCWTTAICIWGLSGTNYKGKYMDILNNTILWLVKQQNEDNGWGVFPGNESNIFVTSIIIYVLKIYLVNYTDLNKKNIIEKCIENGVSYVLSKENKIFNGWCQSNKYNTPDATCTGMAVWSIHWCMNNSGDKFSIIERGIKYLREMIKDRDIWQSNIVAKAVYNNGVDKKIIYGYSPAIALSLISIGLSPKDEMISKTIKYLYYRHQSNGWPIEGLGNEPVPGYSRNFPNEKPIESYSFTTALALWTIETWHKAIFREQLKLLTETWAIKKHIKTDKEKIFIVHGHDILAREIMARFIEKIGCEAIILQDETNKGSTIIEKIESYSNVRYGIILYTPDDDVLDNENINNKRARQNVVLEHGYLMAKLGRNNISIMKKGDVNLPTDISGIVFINMDESWEMKLAKEMKRSGLNIDLNLLT